MQTGNVFRGRVLIVAFEGWNDAGDAASMAVATIAESIESAPLLVMDSETYYDYQDARPYTRFDDEGKREISWPTTTFSGPVDNTGNIYLLNGVEPSRSWQSFTEEVIDMCRAVDIQALVLLGAMLADVPHTRNVPVYLTSENASVRAAVGAERSSYEGPTGIIGVLAVAAESAGIPVVSLWASVPHYVHHGPCPKAALALLQKVEDIIDIVIPHGGLDDEASAWQSQVDRLAADDEDMAAYIASLEQQRDVYDSPQASGESIAEEFERFLRGRENKPPEPRG